MNLFRLLVIVAIAALAWKMLGGASESVSARELSPGHDVVMFTTPTCGYCKKARRYFNDNDVPFRDFDITRSASASDKFDEIGGRGVPVVIIGDERIDGFSTTHYDRALAEL